MRDIGTHHFVKAGKGVNNVLVPQPSNDPADPLNWSLKWKLATIITSNCVTFFQVSPERGSIVSMRLLVIGIWSIVACAHV